MLTYRVRPRIFRHGPGEELVFPNDASFSFHFKPDQPFGVTPGGGKTTVRAKPASALFDSNTGRHSVESKEPLKPLDVTIVEPEARIELRGTTLTISMRVDSLARLHERIETFYFALPMLLGLQFADPPYVERVDGSVGGVPFRWELREWIMSLTTTTQEQQEESVAAVWDHLTVLGHPERRRLLAAIHYYHVAARLLAVSTTPGEFLSEAIVNFAKVLEVLFPPAASGGSIDAARAGLASLGYAPDAIEADFVPALALRNRVDSGHPDLTIFTPDQLRLFHAYAERAEHVFKAFLLDLLIRIKHGTYEVAPGRPSAPEREDLLILERLARAFPETAG